MSKLSIRAPLFAIEGFLKASFLIQNLEMVLKAGQTHEIFVYAVIVGIFQQQLTPIVHYIDRLFCAPIKIRDIFSSEFVD